MGCNGCPTKNHETRPKSRKTLYSKARILYAFRKLEDAVPEICCAAADSVARWAFLKESDFWPLHAGLSALASRAQSIEDCK